MITQINEFKIHLINEASYDQLQHDMVDTKKIEQSVFDDVKKNIQKSAYGTWILKMIIDKIILPEDVYKYNEYFDIFDRNKNKYKFKDIFQYKSKSDLSIFLSKTLEIKELENKDVSSIKGVSKNEKYKQYEIGNVGGFTVYELPKGNEDLYGVSCDLGSGTEWCTATGNSRKHFDRYINKDSLFIFIKGNEKYQFHYEEKQFMDKNDKDIFDKNNESKKYILDLFKFIQNKYPNNKNYKIPSEVNILFNDLKNININNLSKNEWDWISIYKKLPEDFIREFQDKLDWEFISYYQVLSEDFIREFQNNVDWEYISRCQLLSEDFIREFKDNVRWEWISKYQKLSEDFIREFKNKVDWLWISISQKLSEDFIREFKNYVNWKYISKYQVLSENFIIEFQDKLEFHNLMYNDKLSKELKDKIKLIYNK